MSEEQKGAAAPLPEPVAWQYRRFYRDPDDTGWGRWHNAENKAEADYAASKPDTEVRALYAGPLAAPLPGEQAGWVDEFGNVFPLAAHSIDGKPLSWVNAHKRKWEPLYRARAVLSAAQPAQEDA